MFSRRIQQEGVSLTSFIPKIPLRKTIDIFELSVILRYHSSWTHTWIGGSTSGPPIESRTVSCKALIFELYFTKKLNWFRIFRWQICGKDTSGTVNFRIANCVPRYLFQNWLSSQSKLFSPMQIKLEGTSEFYAYNRSCCCQNNSSQISSQVPVPRKRNRYFSGRETLSTHLTIEAVDYRGFLKK